MLIFDGHLDPALNALTCDRDLTLDVEAIRRREAGGVYHQFGTCCTSLPTMRRGGVGLCVATLLARAKSYAPLDRDCKRTDADWSAQSMAYAIARGQLAYYRLLEEQGHITLITDRAMLAAHTELLEASPDEAPLGVIVTLEGADPVVEPEQLHAWHALGVRTLMMAHFGRSHYCHGTPSNKPGDTHDVDGPLTDMGRALLKEMAVLRMPLDLTHTSDRSFAESVELYGGPIYSSHTACRALVDIPRNHSDEQLKAIVERGGVVGLPLYNSFLNLVHPDSAVPSDTGLDCLVRHVDHVCQIAGDAKHVALGSDLDGGFGSEHTPHEIDTAADLPKIAEALGAHGYGADDVAAIVHGNWLRFFGAHLPAD